MSALPRIATAKADSRDRSCLLYTRKQTLIGSCRMSTLCQTRLYAYSKMKEAAN
jgi:hypothetical protein